MIDFDRLNWPYCGYTSIIELRDMWFPYQYLRALLPVLSHQSWVGFRSMTLGYTNSINTFFSLSTYKLWLRSRYTVCSESSLDIGEYVRRLLSIINQVVSLPLWTSSMQKKIDLVFSLQSPKRETKQTCSCSEMQEHSVGSFACNLLHMNTYIGTVTYVDTTIYVVTGIFYNT